MGPCGSRSNPAASMWRRRPPPRVSPPRAECGIGQVDGRREVLGLVVGPSEAETFWTEFLRSLTRARQALLDSRAARSPTTASDAAAPSWAQQRPRYLFSGLMVCGACGGGFSKISAAHFGCSTARNKGETACTNRLTIRRDLLEETVLGALRARLMDPDLFRAFVAAFTAEWNRLQAETSAGTQGKRQELGRVTQQIERLVDAIAEGTPAAAVRDRMTTLSTPAEI